MELFKDRWAELQEFCDPRAMRSAAATIQTRPDLYNYQACLVPKRNTCGCVIGWMAYYQGYPSGEVIPGSVGTQQISFYKALGDALGSHEYRHSPAAAVYALRILADQLERNHA